MKNRIFFLTTLVLILAFMFGCPNLESRSNEIKKRADVPEYFVICTVNLDGSDLREVIRDPNRQLSHIRVSHDHQWITFTRFNKLNSKGVAVEEEGYEETEIMISRLDGSELRTLVPPKKGVGSANSNWIPTGKKLVYVSDDNPERKGKIYSIDSTTSKREQIATAPGVEASDPFIRDQWMVYSARKKKGSPYAIRIAKLNDTNDRQVSFPKKGFWGDFDPKLSPDGSTVAFMRLGPKGPNGGVDIMSVDIVTGKETLLSERNNKNLDGVPEWSSDGRLIIYWHIDRHNPLKSGIYSIRPNATDRKQIPLPIGYHYGTAQFFPGSGSSENTKIIFAARRYPPEIFEKLEKFKALQGQ